MLHIFCPHCGEYREEEEFRCKGQAHIARPLDPEACSDEEWGHFMFFRQNTRGQHRELWVHSTGCRKHFNVIRNTVTYEIEKVYLVGTKPETEGAAS
ncbi:sarcosine oxidase subunit delta [Parathalassolituus penaei]|uniref:Sarcosine oxidase subunit delta n=1 Tax=Parathalassolituus penaei TaxID=2997323 RepID=A0A9X3ITB4_9GAMM|nr:sarcosine oxidase subunit delta [Parathalassolituus penaei]MCY0967312.1 sarcosine oxidase subunit delta [Parathalassolituus penaei]